MIASLALVGQIRTAHREGASWLAPHQWKTAIKDAQEEAATPVVTLRHSTSIAPGEGAKLPVWEVQSSATKLALVVDATPRVMQRSAGRIAQEEFVS